MPGAQARVQLRGDVRIGGAGVDVGHGEVRGSMEGEFDGEAWRSLRDGCLVEPSGRLLVLFAILVTVWRSQLVLSLPCLLLEIASFVDELGRECIVAVGVGYLGLGVFVLHASNRWMVSELQRRQQ